MARSGISNKTQNRFARLLLGGAMLLPYRWRVPFVGSVTDHVVAPLAGWRQRVRANLAYAIPEMDKVTRERIVRRVADNFGRTLIEIYSGEAFIARARDSEMTGPGLAALKAAREDSRPIVLLTAHLGNYDAVRGKLSREGFPMAALFRPMKNPGFQAHYLKAIKTIAEPVFPTDGKGIAGLIRHLKGGGTVGIVADVGNRGAPVLSFFGKPAHTPLSAAELALKYDAALIPVFGIRQADGLSFRIHVAAPIAPGTAEEMMQAFNDSVEAIVRAHPEQWFWIHRRWKLRRTVRDRLSEAERPPE